MADEIAKYTGKNNVQDFDGYFDKIKRYPTPAGALQGYFPVTDGNGQMILRSFTEPGSEGEANANIAPLEDGPTASQAYAVGGLMVYQGQLMTVVQAIVEGGAITPGTNVMSYTVAQALQQKANQAAVNAALAGKLNVIGKGINLLEGWYFVGGGSQQGNGQLPINQRGYASYPAGSHQYSIDRWQHRGGGTMTLEADGLAFSFAAGSTSDDIIQTVSTPKSALEGRALTASVLFSNGTLLWGTSVLPPAETALYNYFVSSETIEVISSNQSESSFVTLYFRIKDQSKRIAAVKYEMGTVQTLAHQDDSGSWILNDPPPNYQQELAMCQRYQEKVGRMLLTANSSGIVDVTVPWKVTKRLQSYLATVTSVNGVENKLSYWAGNGWVDVDVQNPSSTENASMYGYRVTASGIPANNVVQFSLFGDANL